MKIKNKMAEILLIEDNPGDVRLTKEALKVGKIINHLTTISDGEDAIKYLQGKSGADKNSLPDLILLDLNLPKVSGREILDKIKSDEHLKHIPVIILTTSKSEEDILKSYQSHANCYITKPVDYDQFIEVVRKMEDFWFTIVKIPHKNSNGNG